MQGFLIFALGGWGEGGEAGELAAGDEPKHDFGGDENGDECSDCDYNGKEDLVCQNASRPPIAGRPDCCRWNITSFGLVKPRADKMGAVATPPVLRASKPLALN